MSRRRIAGARALITGASSGIGREIALELARQGAKLLLVARRQDRLQDLAREVHNLDCQAVIEIGDVTDAQVQARVLQSAAEQLGGLDLLVNNAGVGALGPFLEADVDRLRRVMEVNFFAPAELMRRAVPYLRQGILPMIVNVGSVLGHRAVPRKSEYCASKFALHGLSDALRAELSSEGIDLLLVSPSTTRTEFFDNVLEKNTESSWPPTGGMPARAVAKKTVHAIRQGRHEIILSPGGKLLVWADRLCPPLMNRLIARFG